MSFKVKINICRICMQTEKGESILACESLKRKFAFTTNLQITADDDLPNIICKKCKMKLKIAYDFILKAQTSDKELRRFLAKINNDFQYVANGVTLSDDTYEMEDEDVDAVSLKKFSRHKSVTKKSKAETQCSSTAEDKQILDELEDVEIKCENFLEQMIIESKENNDTSDIEEEIDYQMKSAIADAEAEERANEEEIAYGETIFTEEVLEEISSVTPETTNSYEYNGNDSYLEQYENMLSQNSNNNNDNVVCIEHDETMQDDLTEYNDDDNDALKLTQEQELENVELEEEEDETLYFFDKGEKDEYTEMQTLQDDNTEIKLLTADGKNLNKMKPIKTGQSAKLHVRTGRPSHNSANTKFYCIKCNRDFSTKTNLTRHLATHEGKKPYQCTICNKGFTQNGSLKQHLYTHTGEKPFTCADCGRGFTQCKSLVFHMRRHTGEKPFRCDYCGMFFRQKDGLKTHILKHHTIMKLNGNESMHFCVICKKQFSKNAALQMHMKKHVNNSNATAPQNLGNASEIIVGILDEEEFLANPKDPLLNPDFTLNIDESTQIVDVLATSTVELSRAKKFQCRKCFKCFAIKSNLIRHLSMHSTPISELFTCNKCEIAFDSSFALKHHLVKEHNQVGINLSECDECQIKFTDESELAKHMENTHNLICSECPDLIFTTQRALIAHNKLKHFPSNDGDDKLLESTA